MTPPTPGDTPDAIATELAGLAAFAKGPLLRSDLVALAERGDVTYAQRDEILIRQGAEPLALKVLLSGDVELFGAANGEEAVMLLARPGDCFIPAAVVTGDPYLMTARALTPGRLLAVPRPDLLELAGARPAVASWLLVVIGQQFRGMVRQVTSLKLKAADQRLALYLLELTSLRGGPATVRLPQHKSRIASRVGIRPETLSRTLASLREQGVTTDGSLVQISDVGALERFCLAPDEVR